MKSNATLRFGLLLATSLLCGNVASGQQATEVYIPIGDSPGVSASKSLTGVIQSVDYVTHSIDIKIGDELRTVRVSDKTRYYLDRSRSRLSSSTGKFQDCRKGQTIEAKLSSHDTVEWIKIEAD